MIPTQPWYRRLTCWLGFHRATTYTNQAGIVTWCPLCARPLGVIPAQPKEKP